MNLTVAYHRRSEVVQRPGGLAVSLAPNLRRDRVSFLGTLRQPLRFREAISAVHDVSLGTTNVDYSWALYEHFQKLRSYRETRFVVDPAGFEVQTRQGADYREEKIDLPASWLRGFMQLQSAMSLPMRRVPVSREGLYNVVAWLKRHRAAKSPRAVRFELQLGQPVAIVLEPWERRIVVPSRPYPG